MHSYRVVTVVLISDLLNGNIDFNENYGQILVELTRSVDLPIYPTFEHLLQSIHAGLGSDLAALEYFEAIRSSLEWRLKNIASPDDLIELFLGINNSLKDQDTGQGGTVSALSSLGMFVRRMTATFNLLSFESIGDLLTAIHHYIEGKTSDDIQNIKTGLDYYNFEVNFEKAIDLNSGREDSAQMDTICRVLMSGEMAREKELLFTKMTLLQHDLAAVDHSHAAFDVAPASDSLNFIGGRHSMKDNDLGEQDLQNASISLSNIHAHLGNVEESLQALNEAVRIAQQQGDDYCLVHALATLAHVMDITTPGTIQGIGDSNAHMKMLAAAKHYSQLRALLRRLRRRAEELKVPHLVAYALFALARVELLRRTDQAQTSSLYIKDDGPQAALIAGDSTAKALQDLEHLHLSIALAAAVPVLPNSSTVPAEEEICTLFRGINEFFAPSNELLLSNGNGSAAFHVNEVERYALGARLLRASCWEVFGCPTLSRAHILSFLIGYGGREASSVDAQTGLAQLAVNIASQEGPLAALKVLDAATSHFPRSEGHVLAGARLAIQHDRALNRSDLQTARDVAASMAALANPTDATDIMLRLEAEERAIRTLVLSGDYAAAAKSARSMFSVAVGTGQPLHAARLLVLLGRIFLEAGASRVAMKYLGNAILHCRNMRLDILHAEAVVVYAQALCDVHQPELAEKELELVLPIIFGHGSLELKSRARLVLAETVVQKHKTVEALQGDLEWLKELLDEAAIGFKALENAKSAAKVEYLRAILMNAVGDIQARNTAAMEFRRLESAFTTF